MSMALGRLHSGAELTSVKVADRQPVRDNAKVCMSTASERPLHFSRWRFKSRQFFILVMGCGRGAGFGGARRAIPAWSAGLPVGLVCALTGKNLLT